MLLLLRELSLRINKLNWGLIFFVIMSMVQTDALAGHYVVDSTSRSTNWDRAEWLNYPSVPPDCTPSTPVTAMRMAQAGDAVYFRGGEGGNYNLTVNPNYGIPALNPANNGTAKRPIQFLNFPNERPHLKNILIYPNKGYWHPLIGAIQKEWIIWKGFELSAESAAGAVVFDISKHCILENCRVEGKVIPAKKRRLTNYNAINIRNFSEFITIRNCLVLRVHGTDGVNGAGIKLYSGYHTTVENCTFLENDYAIHDKNDGRHNVYKRNFIRSNVIGIELGAMAGGPPSEDIEISNNIILLTGSSGIGINIIASLSAVDAVHGLRCYNNVIDPNGSVGINFNSGFLQQYYNNIIVNSSVALRHVGDKGEIDYCDYNDYFGGQTFILRDYQTNRVVHKTLENWQKSGELSGEKHPDIHSLSADPLFFNSIGNQPLDYRLRTNSPCIGAGKGGVNMGPLPPHTVGRISFVSDGLGEPSPPTGLKVVQ
ncbi:MAG TPA: right-handed parallel beta-helix repeat-containing protein [Desulfobacteraceae bacterium]|nr:right-handed parallel beta-helix repeat-containing protein [Desulfobacteraceae bacterium]HPJ67684.1 right-handed parallel beta-helix repeat-containing protein [Desulfobacteraceae bacterium]HPQ27816.1 right-handed parallel beta-helix repeat-containing protein [Desulfobacteraceae bacterium]